MAIETSSQAVVPVAKHIARTGSNFTDGLCSGYLTYYDQHQGKPLADQDLCGLLAEALADPQYCSLFLTGYCVGFIEALIEDRDLFAR